jgi:hypothetical protein
MLVDFQEIRSAYLVFILAMALTHSRHIFQDDLKILNGLHALQIQGCNLEWVLRLDKRWSHTGEDLSLLAHFSDLDGFHILDKSPSPCGGCHAGLVWDPSPHRCVDVLPDAVHRQVMLL